MGYLLLAILSSVMVSLTMRFSETRIKNRISMLFMNYVMCTVLSAAYMDLKPAEGLFMAAGLGIINGFFYLASFVLFQYNVKRNGVVLSSTFMRLGIIVSTTVPILFFHERPELLQICGLILALASIIMIQTDKEKSAVDFKLGLILLLLLNGSADAMSKVFDELGRAEASDYFLLFTFIVAGLLCLGLVFIKKERIQKAEIFYGMVIGIPNYYSARFLLLALRDVPAVIAYPTSSVATIVIISIAGVLFFKEVINKRQAAALLGILAALVLLNI